MVRDSRESMPRNSRTVSDLGASFTGWLDNLPWGTKALTVLLIAIYVTTALVGYDERKWCSNPPMIVVAGQVWRLFTNAFFHLSILHIIFNVISFQPMGSACEHKVGTTQFLWFILQWILLTSAILVAVSYVGSWIMPSYTMLMAQCPLGFSCVIFALLTQQSLDLADTVGTQSVFGLFSVPTRLYPWALLVFLQVVMGSSTSFLGHLSGILVGHIHHAGYLDRLRLSPRVLNAIETSAPCVPLTRLHMYIVHPDMGSLPTHAPARRDAGSAAERQPFVAPGRPTSGRGAAASASASASASAAAGSSTTSGAGGAYQGQGYRLGGAS